MNKVFYFFIVVGFSIIIYTRVYHFFNDYLTEVQLFEEFWFLYIIAFIFISSLFVWRKLNENND